MKSNSTTTGALLALGLALGAAALLGSAAGLASLAGGTASASLGSHDGSERDFLHRTLQTAHPSKP